MPNPPPHRYPAFGFLLTGALAVFVVWFTFSDQLVTAFSPPVDRVTTGSVD